MAQTMNPARVVVLPGSRLVITSKEFQVTIVLDPAVTEALSLPLRLAARAALGSVLSPRDIGPVSLGVEKVA